MQTATSIYTSTFKTPQTRTTLVGEHYAPMSEPLSSGAGAGTTICQHCGSDRFSQDAIAAQQRIQELEAEVRELTAKALETAGKIANYENDVRTLREQAHAFNSNNNHNDQTTPTPEVADTNTQQQQQQQQQQGRFANLASYFPYRRANSRTGSKDSSTSHTNQTNSSPDGNTSPTNHTSDPSQHSLSRQNSSNDDSNSLETALTREKMLRKAAESQLSQAHSELEDLTAQLFSQANEMVAQERKARAKLEERVALLEKRDGDKRKRLDRLEKAIARVERVKGLINS